MYESENDMNSEEKMERRRARSDRALKELRDKEAKLKQRRARSERALRSLRQKAAMQRLLEAEAQRFLAARFRAAEGAECPCSTVLVAWADWWSERNPELRVPDHAFSVWLTDAGYPYGHDSSGRTRVRKGIQLVEQR